MSDHDDPSTGRLSERHIKQIEHLYLNEKKPLYEREKLLEISKLLADWRSGKIKSPTVSLPHYDDDSKQTQLILDMGIDGES